jgi:hypothetical protein
VPDSRDGAASLIGGKVGIGSTTGRVDFLPRRSLTAERSPHEDRPLALAGLVATGVLTANTAHADVAAAPVPSHFYPLQPPFGPVIDPDPVLAVQNFQGQTAELHDKWGTLSPDERNQRIKALQQVAPLIEAETRDVAPGQQLQVEGMLLAATFQLADLLGQL